MPTKTTKAAGESAAKKKKAEDDSYEEMFPGWVYQMPGLLLMAGGLGAFVFMAVV